MLAVLSYWPCPLHLLEGRLASMLGRHSRPKEGSHNEEQRAPDKSREALGQRKQDWAWMILWFCQTKFQPCLTLQQPCETLVVATKDFLAPKPTEIYQAFLSMTLSLFGNTD